MTSNNRASLLSGLRTGGVRSASGPIAPHTAAIGGSFQIPRFISGQHPALYEEPSDIHTLHYNHNHHGMPMTAGLVDGLGARFSQQQQAPSMQQAQHHQMLRQAQIAAMSGMQGLPQPMDHNQQHLLQMQFMQAMVLQQQQAQRLQAEIALQQQVAMTLAAQQDQQQQLRAASRIPSTAGPMQTTFDQRIPAPQLRNFRLDGANADDVGPVPMTAALGGKFGSRPLNPAVMKQADEQQNSSSTVVISGGVSLGASGPIQTGPSKSDAATSWRRGSAVVGNPRNTSPPKLENGFGTPTVTISAPEETRRSSPGDITSSSKYRPQPLRINNNGASPITTPTLVIETEEGQTSTVLAGPPSPASSQSSLEGLSRKYEGLGIGRPVLTVASSVVPLRSSQPVRQPRGPPAGADDLGLKNFASRIKRTVVVPVKEAAFVEAY